MKEAEILAELKKLNDTLSGMAQELAILHQWIRERDQYPRTVRVEGGVREPRY